LIETSTRGDPESPLRWLSRSARNIASQLVSQGFKISRGSVLNLLHERGFTLQQNRKVLEGTDHPDRNAQFEYINTFCARLQGLGQPAISVDTKKNWLIAA
jgi:hypothetical protein